ncbi:MAG: hypothetical protein WBL25_16805 [Anaerolineales bacterium]
MIFPALFAILVGIGMIIQWTLSFFKVQIPELQTEPIRIKFHIAAEILTAASLLVAGIGLLISMPWATSLFLVAVGMLLYTSVVSPGYFAQQGQWGWLVIFGIIIILGITSILIVL